MIIFGSIPNPLFSNFHSQNPKPSYFSKMVSELHGWSSPPSSCHKTLFPVIFDLPSFLLTHSIISHLWRLAKMEKQSVPFLPLRATRSITAKNEKPSAKLQWTPNALIFGSIYSSSQNPNPLVQSNKDSIDFKKPQSRDADKVLHPSHLKIPATTTTMSAPKAVVAMIRLVVPAGGARPTPPVRPALNLMAFCKDFNARTQKYKPDLPMAVTITAFKDKKVEQDSQQLQICPTCATISRMYQASGVVFSISAAFLVIRAPRRSVESAFKVFETMPERNLVTWNSMMYVCSEPRVATMILSVPYNEFLSRIKSNQVRKVEVDGVHIMFKLKSGVGTSHDGEVSRTSSRLQESESLVKSVSPTRRIVYTTTRPSDIRTPYEKMVDNGVEFGCPNRRFVGFFNSALIALFYVDVLAGLLHRFLVSFSHHTAGQIRNHKSGTSNRYWFQVDIG